MFLLRLQRHSSSGNRDCSWLGGDDYSFCQRCLESMSAQEFWKKIFSAQNILQQFNNRRPTRRCTGRGAVRWPGAYAASCFASLLPSDMLAREGAAPVSARSLGRRDLPQTSVSQARSAIIGMCLIFQELSTPNSTRRTE